MFYALNMIEQKIRQMFEGNRQIHTSSEFGLLYAETLSIRVKSFKNVSCML
jgi:hypothetical protein